ncbi:sulfatase-like hydrolase/transferase [Aporhodopirellula aestuarii]|uniref:Sulfatase-like hydrolase/transferase n=1 Tax=Aporhodopirellula aestuarii TaxID=2950107 RepID=A0ABT0UBZ9_9BACT|nr:sulfatase-like hydrolase/transferase [Aporhodopirellula aestuarii]MCM2374342.1 sulfatase-like hydrolase/transferase [Aporhodopirellula aestuarii]
MEFIRTNTSTTTHLVLCACMLLVAPLEAKTINVADHGIVPGKDVTYAVNQLLESVKDEAGVTLVFPQGQYDFYPENAIEMYRAVANHDNGLKRIGFPIFDCEDITIDGGGSTFMFHGRLVPVTIERTRGVALKNFTIDWVRSFHAEMTVVDRDESNKSFEVETDPKKYPYTISGGELLFQRYGQDDPIGANMVFDPATRSPIFETNQYSVNSNRAKVTATGQNRFRIENAVKRAPPVGSVLVAYGVHPTSRLCQAIHVTNSADVRLENVTIHDAGGMGLIVERTDNVTLDHLVVTSTEDRIVSTRADATHFIGCKGTIQLEDCLFEHMLDDGINVHGAYVKVAEYLGDREFLCEISHFQQWGLTFAEPGDKIALLSRTTILPFAETTVEDVKVLNEHRFVMTVAEVPESMPEGPLSVENLTWYPDLIMRNNTIRENRARSVLVTTKGKVLIENNYFSSQMHGILIEGDNNKWYESGAVEDVTIRNNVFDNIGYEATARYPLVASPLFTSDQHWGEARYHRNISFTGNTLKSFNGLIASAKSVQGLEISGNKIEFSTDYPTVDVGEAIVLEYCDDVTIRDNKVIGFDHELKVNVSSDTTNVSISKNDGLGGGNAKQPEANVNDVGANSRRPNILLLFVDDLGWNDLGYRNSKFETPNIDRLAAESVDFQRAYIASPTCSPSRATLLTGKHPARLQIVRHIPNETKYGFDPSGRTDEEFHLWATDPAQFPCRNWLPLEHTTYAEALKNLGYHNQFFGKWHLGHEPFHPIRQGFDEQFGTSNAGHPKSYYPPFFKNSDVLADVKDRYLTDTLTDGAVKFVEQYERDQPFMLSMWYYNVHRPPVPRRDLVEHFSAKGYGKEDAVYAAQVKAVDESVGRLRDALARKGIEDDTIVIFLSDQGSWYQNLPLRGSKRVDTLCEGGARVPMMVYWPGVAKPTQNFSLVQSTDLFPTLVEIAGGDPSRYEDLDGVSLVETIRQNTKLNRGEPLFGYRAYEDLYASVREGDWKLLAYRSGNVSLYNIPQDESEENDVAQSHPGIVKSLTQRLIEWEKRMNVESYSGVQ